MKFIHISRTYFSPACLASWRWTLISWGHHRGLEDRTRVLSYFPGSSHELKGPQRELEGPEQRFSHVGPGDADELGAAE
jgi:hypothetical protein